MSEQAIPNIPHFQLHHRLALALEDADVSVAEMAAVIGYSVKQTGNYLHGRQAPRSGTIAAWALRCGVDRDWLATGVTPSNPDGPSDQGLTGKGCYADVITLRAA